MSKLFGDSFVSRGCFFGSRETALWLKRLSAEQELGLAMVFKPHKIMSATNCIANLPFEESFLLAPQSSHFEKSIETLSTVEDQSFLSLVLPSDEETTIAAEPISRNLCADATPSPTTRRVAFDTVQIREYSRTVSYHPCCSNGPGVGLDWGYSKETTISLDAYEEKRNRGGKCFLEELVLAWGDREDILMETTTLCTFPRPTRLCKLVQWLVYYSTRGQCCVWPTRYIREKSGPQDLR